MSDCITESDLSILKNYPQQFSPFENSSMSFQMGSRNRRVIGINLLPVIKEETASDDNEIELRNVFFSNSKLKENYKNKKTFNILQNKEFDYKAEKVKKFEKESKIRPKLLLKLPPLVNINCMMNVDVKQSQPIWETSFGKKLIYGKENSKTFESTNAKIFSPKVLNPIRGNNECLDNQYFIGNNVLNKSKQNQERKDRAQSCGSFKSINKKRKLRKLTKGNYTNKKQLQDENESKNPPKSTLRKQKSNRIITENSITFKEPSIDSSSRNQHFLSECVRSILEDTNTHYDCEFCEKTFTNTDEFYRHIEIHEEEKQVCLLCDKTFYNGKQFVQHLFTHEGVDRFSCKICKKYFPSSRKYKRHYKEFHETSSEAQILYSDDKPNELYLKKQFREFKCKRCEEKFSSEDAHKAHKRNHIRMDLMGAYLLNAATNV